MVRQPLDDIASWLEPWNQTPHSFLASVQNQIPFDALAVGVPAEKPRLDELLACQGLPVAQIVHWFEEGHRQDKLLKQAMRVGSVTAEPCEEAKDIRVDNHHHAMMLVLPESGPTKRWWWLMLARKRPFTAKEVQLACLMLRYWQMRFDVVPHRDMWRLLLGDDDRLILADVATQARLLNKPDLLQPLISVLHPVMDQRYPKLADNATRDMVVKLNERTFAAYVRRSRGIDAPAAAGGGGGASHWYVELHPLDEQDLPAVGLVEDERIALALAYIHENFHASPSLAQVAKKVHISPFHFHRLFTRQVGISPKHYLQKKQLQEAKWLLRQGGVPIGEVATRAGFSSHGHFTSTFHRVVGDSPSDYRDRG